MSWPLKLLKISGHSMQPAIKHGNVVLINRWAYRLKKPQINDIVVFRQGRELWCKRITGKKTDGYLLQGDNRSDTSDSSSVSEEQIIGRVLIL